MQAAKWETHAALTSSQFDAITQLAAVCRERAIADQAVSSSSQPQATQPEQRVAGGTELANDTDAQHSTDQTGSISSAAVSQLQGAVLHSAAEFYTWHAELEQARTIEADAKLEQYGNELKQYVSMCDGITQQIDNALEDLERIKQSQSGITQHTSNVSNQCHTLLLHKSRQSAMADIIQSHLSHFRDLSELQSLFSAGATSADGEQFLEQLEVVDKCFQFVSAHPQYKDAAVYIAQLRGLQAKGFAALLTKVGNVLQHAATQIQFTASQGKAQKVGDPNAQDSAIAGGSDETRQEVSETALYYVKFRAVAEPGVKDILQTVSEKAGTSSEYKQLLEQCVTKYCSLRCELMVPVVKSKLVPTTNGDKQLSHASGNQGLAELCRNAFVYLLQVSRQETQLFDALFPNAYTSQSTAKFSAAQSASGLNSARTTSHSVGFRDSFGQSDNDNGVVHPVRQLMEPLATVLYDVLRPAVLSMVRVEDLAELAQVFTQQIQVENLSFDSSRADFDALKPMINQCVADIQSRLIYRAQVVLREKVNSYVPTANDLDYPKCLQKAAEQALAGESAAVTNGEEHSAEIQEVAQPAAHAPSTWYPPIQCAVHLLSSIYPCLDTQTFAGICGDAVVGGMASVETGSKLITKSAGQMHGVLFQVRHLLLLREQLATYSVDLTVVNKELDFGHMAGYLRRLVAGETSLFSWASSVTSSALQALGPRVHENQVDSKKQLERTLRLSCEQLIMTFTRAAVDPMLGFITKVTATRAAAGQSGSIPSMNLREQAFATPERLASIVSLVADNLRNVLPDMVKSMKLYLPNPATQAILFKPIQGNITEAHGQISALLDKEYTHEDVAKIRLTSPRQLKDVLDQMIA